MSFAYTSSRVKVNKSQENCSISVNLLPEKCAKLTRGTGESQTMKQICV